MRPISWLHISDIHMNEHEALVAERGATGYVQADTE